ncbi:MAG TPA: hypothetical protein VGN61_15255 [Verrucomicrobiae bacterium]|jgi:hypothetical protein
MKPKPNEFAQEVLWRLARIQGEVYETRLLVSELLAKVSGKPVRQVLQQWKPKSEKLTKDIYLKSLKTCGFADE